jgi:glycerol-3-phosphate dehydrogenase (NAD(P)+)
MRAGIIGAGGWGSAFAIHLGRLGIRTRLWVREEEVFRDLRRTRRNSVFLPGFSFPRSISFSRDIRETAGWSEVLFIAVPSRFCRSVFSAIASDLSASQVVVSLTKGIEERTLKRMTEIMSEIFPRRVKPTLAVLSGPSFAREVAERHPTAVVVACSEAGRAGDIQRLISNVHFRAYTSHDVVGVELAGAMKNVIAIAAGISDSLGAGHNSRAALITRGIAEMTRLGVKLGARKETFLGLAGIGDLILTCTARLSRNYRVGFELGKGRSLERILSETKMVAEGVTTTVSVRNLARREGTEMPISDEVYRVLYENKKPRVSLRDLMRRTLKVE